MKQQLYYPTIMEYDYIFKILVLGSHCTGKTSILHKFTDNIALVNPQPTIGVDFKTSYHKDFLNRNIKLHFWDTGGHPDYDSIIESYYKNTAGAIIVFDVTNPRSFIDVDYFLQNLALFSNSNIKLPILLIGNKVDKKDKRVISSLEAMTYAKENKLYYLETGKNADVDKDKDKDKDFEDKFGEFFNGITRHYIDNNISHPGVRRGYKTISINENSRDCNNTRQKMDCCFPS